MKKQKEVDACKIVVDCEIEEGTKEYLGFDFFVEAVADKNKLEKLIKMNLNKHSRPLKKISFVEGYKLPKAHLWNNKEIRGKIQEGY